MACAPANLAVQARAPTGKAVVPDSLRTIGPDALLIDGRDSWPASSPRRRSHERRCTSMPRPPPVTRTTFPSSVPAGSGIGRASALALAREGSYLVNIVTPPRGTVCPPTASPSTLEFGQPVN